MVEKKGKNSGAKVNVNDSRTPTVTPEKLVEEIKQRAYETHVARGGKPGFELDDWLNAEREIKAKYHIAG
jgi:hypothetical protein